MKYTNEQLEWIKIHSQCKEWENIKAFTCAFNSHFNLNKSCDAVQAVMNRRGISINSKCNNARLTEDQIEWIKKNLTIIEWKNQKHFTDTFNAIFRTNVSVVNMNQILYKHKWKVSTKHNTNHWTFDMDEWLKENYHCDFVKLARDFNNYFNSDKSAGCITKHLERIGIHKPKPKKGQINRTTFKPRTAHTKELPVGTIRYNSDGRPFIKVKLCEGQNIHTKRGGHNYKEPWWKSLQKKIWEDHYGEVPEGYVVCSLNGNPNDTNIENIGIIDKRGTAVMAKKGWWTDNIKFTKTGAQWCNLYYTAKDYGING